MGSSCCTVAAVEAAFLVVLVTAFVAVAALSGYVLLKLFAGPR
jgi:hypothetical protein